MLTTNLKSFDTFVFVTSTSSSNTLSLTRIGWIVIPISTGIACGLMISSKVVYEIVMQKYNEYKKQYQSYQQTIKSFNKLNRKSIQDDIFDTEYLDEMKNESVS